MQLPVVAQPQRMLWQREKNVEAAMWCAGGSAFEQKGVSLGVLGLKLQ